jgi:hypothetical protein
MSQSAQGSQSPVVPASSADQAGNTPAPTSVGGRLQDGLTSSSSRRWTEAPDAAVIQRRDRRTGDGPAC